MSSLLNSAPLIASGTGSAIGYGPILILILLMIVVSTTIILLTHFLPKPKRSGPVKDGTYESGVPVIGNARRRFNVRFYLVAMLFLLFDVELIFMYPWARLFTVEASAPMPDPAVMSFLFYEMVIFFGILLVGFTYAWKKRVFQYD